MAPVCKLWASGLCAVSNCKKRHVKSEFCKYHNCSRGHSCPFIHAVDDKRDPTLYVAVPHTMGNPYGPNEIYAPDNTQWRLEHVHGQDATFKYIHKDKDGNDAEETKMSINRRQFSKDKWDQICKAQESRNIGRSVPRPTPLITPDESTLSDLAKCQMQKEAIEKKLHESSTDLAAKKSFFEDLRATILELMKDIKFTEDGINESKVSLKYYESKVIQLTNELQLASSSSASGSTASKCGVCMERDLEMVGNCGHHCVCKICSKELTECPYCRTPNVTWAPYVCMGAED